ncbi:hypothetical protein BN7_6179 [Wickerhamomyces ciferrii]|uniref:Uncharacterized protein n=1 Tax=Wickerhamomyces ciferrii (strain ATCC 14091 / BCRC 22168 / CBS 111 / JCM 3599 / NBRC 0793 / NRRL Y-1031 F-60-10) TaxID=1206466 RepID=K0KTS7_WICCF|nr:uncharacterized protein BN7_6179 [Wickerhamomyces ciferrii]CCH46586.1 hypothetical protein BN7_6179 [Wickerhamomyces ciferrii]
MGEQLVVISGGTASNSLVNLFQSLSPKTTYILPVSDNGGSTSEILRVLGGPAIGDLRSRITRLIPDGGGFKELLSYRLSEDSEEAKHEWTQIVEGQHEIWNNLEIQCKEMVRSFLIHVHMELLKKSRNPSTNFKYEMASIGNLLLTGIRLFVGSLDSAIELVLRMTRVSPNIKILPCLNTNYTYHISAQLNNGEVITGQSQISHPNEPISTIMSSSTSVHKIYDPVALHENHEDVPYQHPDLAKSQLHFSKEVNQPLNSPIDKIFYINPYGEEIHPQANSRAIQDINDSKAIIYSIGSLMTSTIPVLILKGIGMSIFKSKSPKILLLNGNHDRETSGLDAFDFILTICKAVNYSISDEAVKLNYTDIITHLMFMENPEIKVRQDDIEAVGIKCIKVSKDPMLGDDLKIYDSNDLQQKLLSIVNQ